MIHLRCVDVETTGEEQQGFPLNDPAIGALATHDRRAEAFLRHL